MPAPPLLSQLAPARTGTKLVAALAALVLGVALVLASALPGRAASRQDVQTFLEVTGFDVALESIRLSAAAGPAMLGMTGSDFATTWSVLTDDVFDVDLMQTMGVDILETALTEEDLEVATGFYGSDLGRRLVAVENESHLSDRADSETLAAEEVARIIDAGDTARIDLLDRLNRAVDVSDNSGRALVEVQYRFLTAARDAGVIELKIDDATLRETLLMRIEETREANRAGALASSAWTYRDFSNEEIEEYAAALEDPGMQRVYELMNAVQYEIMANRFEAVALRLEGVQGSTDL